MTTNEEIIELFQNYADEKLQVEEIAKELKIIVFGLLQSGAISGDERKKFRDIFVSTDQNLDDYNKSLKQDKLHIPGADKNVKEIGYHLRLIVDETREMLMDYMKRQTLITAETKVAKSEEESKPIPKTEDKTLQQYLDAIDQNPDDTAYNNLGNYYFSVGEYDKAIEEYKKAIKIKPQKYIYFSNVGDAYRKMKNWDKSIEWYEKAFEISPNDEILNNSLGIVYYSKGLNEEAMKYYQKAIEKNPLPVYFVNAADACIKLGKLDDAMGYYENALTIDPEYSEANTGYAISILTKCRSDNTCDANTINKAISHFKKSIDINPNDYLAHGGLGLAYSQQNNWEDAIESFNKAIELNPKDDSIYNALGNAYFKKEQYEEAIKCYEKALEINPKSYIYLSNIGDAYRQSKRLDEAETYYNQVLEINPKDAISLNTLGLIYSSKGEFNKAIKYYNDAITNDPTQFIYHANLGLAYQGLKLWDKAIASFKRVIELNPNDERSYSDLGYAYFNKGLFKQSVDELKKASEINPGNPVNYSHLSLVYSRLRKWDEAITYAKMADQKAREINLKDDSYQITLADVYNSKGLDLYNAGKDKEAIEEYNKANSIKETDVQYWNLYIGYFSLGEFKEAKKSLIKAIELKSEPKYLEAIRDPKLK